MPKIGVHDMFELAYMAKLRDVLAARGVILTYEMDRAAIDLGIHLWVHTDDGAELTGPRIWIQAKGLHDSTLKAEQFAKAQTVKTPSIEIDHVRSWYNAPEPVYLVVYVESADIFLAADVRELVDQRGGLHKVVSAGETTTFHISKNQTLQHALDRMPSHRSIRIDGPAWRGRPLGHGIDPLRSALAPMAPELFLDVVAGLLAAHDFHPDLIDNNCIPVRDLLCVDRPTVITGRLYLTYEWVLPMTTEYGYDSGSDFRIEGEPFHAQGDVVVVVDPTGNATPASLAPEVNLMRLAKDRETRRVLVMSNSSFNPKQFGAWFGGLRDFDLWCMPQQLDSLTFNVLTTTKVFLRFHERLGFAYRNYLS
jgi:hypothetical protein